MQKMNDIDIFMDEELVQLYKNDVSIYEKLLNTKTDPMLNTTALVTKQPIESSFFHDTCVMVSGHNTSKTCQIKGCKSRPSYKCDNKCGVGENSYFCWSYSKNHFLKYHSEMLKTKQNGHYPKYRESRKNCKHCKRLTYNVCSKCDQILCIKCFYAINHTDCKYFNCNCIHLN